VPLDNPKSNVARVLAVLGVAAAAAVGPALPALAAQGSVPSEVTRYVDDPAGLVARLDDLFGVTSSGQGIEFGDTTEPGPVTRAWVFTAGYLNGDDPETAVELANLWTVPILIDEDPIGLATVWINPATDAPDLADFVVGATEADALSQVPDDAQLVRDEGRAAWFSLIAGKLVPLIGGTSGVVGSTTLADYQAIASSAPSAAPQDLSGLIGGGILLGATVLAIAGLLAIPALVRRVRASSGVVPTELPAPPPPKPRAPRKKKPTPPAD
jgi:hypothetical protein